MVEQLPAIAYIVEYGQPTQTTYISPQVETLLGYSPAEWLADQKLWRKLLHPDDKERVLAAVKQADATGESLNIEYRLFTRASDIVWVQNRWAILVGEHAVHGLMFDITGRKKIEQALQVERERLAQVINLQQAITRAIPELGEVLRAVLDHARPLTRAEGVVIELAEGDELVYKAASGRAVSQLGLRLKITGSLSGLAFTLGETIYSADTDQDDRVVQPVAREMGVRSMVVVPLTYKEAFGVLKVFSSQPGAFDNTHIQTLQLVAGLIAASISHARNFSANQKLIKERTAALAELERSNQELEQFAYIASHDLKEPLRMVTNYLQLLTNYYANQLDERAKEFIAFAGDGAGRMRLLIDGLLAYSRVGTQGRPLAPTDCAQALQNALTNLQIAIEESRATITVNPLPSVMADEVQLTQLFQNLVGNAIKFRGQALPQIDIGATQHNSEWRFWVRDNGIGLDPEFAERIFIIFQRLHTREEYAGAGLGLAICKRIVERHGGHIWVESQPGQGATFYFTIPAE